MERRGELARLLSLVILAILSGQGSGEDCLGCYTLTISHDKPVAGITNNVTLLCERNETVTQAFDMFMYLRIMREKMDDGEYELIAEMDYLGQITTHLNGVQSTGSNGKPLFLKLRWGLASVTTFGNYYCEGQVMRSIGGFSIETSQLLSITEVISTSEISSVWMSLDDGLGECLEHTSENDTDSRNLKIKAQEFNRQMTMYSFGANWFEGDYGLLMPKAGCSQKFQHYPNFVRIHTESGSEDCPEENQGSHLTTPLQFRNNFNCFVSLRFCANTEEMSTNPWPTGGTYCINGKRDMDCPLTFNMSGILQLDMEDEEKFGFSQGNVAWDDVDKTYIPFCCKNESSADTVVEMPIMKPFYLYRFGGECQRVKNMDIIEEHVDIDTEDELNGDGVEGVVPDVDMEDDKPVRIHLCYYKKSVRRE